MVTRLLLLALAIFVLHSGFQFAEPPVKNGMLEGKMKDLAANRGRKSERSLRKELMAYVREKDIPLNEAKLVVQITNERVIMAASYEIEVEVLGYSRLYEFYPASEEGARLDRRYRSSRSTR